MSKSILVVDDDRDVGESVKAVLEAAGYTVSHALNGLEALQLLRSGLRPNLIILDMMMPVMDGFEFREKQQQDPELRNIPVVVLSAHVKYEDKVHETGISAFLRKPVDMETLLRVTRNHVS